MLLYALRRILTLIPVMLVMTAGIFFATTHLPGDPAMTVLGMESSEADRARVREAMGFNDPIPTQYVRWLSRALDGDLGRSIRTNQRISKIITSRAPVTIQLTLMSMMLAVFVGVPAGIAAARWHRGWVDTIASTGALIAAAIPYFWLGILFIILFAVNLRWLPPSGYVSPFTDLGQSVKLMILPMLTVGLSMAALITRQTRSAMLQVLNEDYVRTARAKGVKERKVVFGHAMPNALIPVVTVVGLQTGLLLGGAIVTERVFSLPGIGSMIIDGIFNRDFPAIQGAMLFIVTAVVIINLITDLSYALLDPRIQY
ncbi:Dipeptide transport system permease protein DppB [Hyphomicrobiales bacterium]|nr:Dipeptide transport system permease protein DppB [Hyphomicrobiales bacterium]CAH1691805.1 Dipeptide transport system permease protein DppB [Hyphomicrobiales bacterium]